MKKLKYTIDEKSLKNLGYIFQKLYAGNHKSYRLEIEKWSYTIWLWVSGKSIEVNDWYGYTYNIIEFYKKNKDDKKYLQEDYLYFSLNRKTGDIFMNYRWIEIEEIMKIPNIEEIDDIDEFRKLKRKQCDDLKEKYEETHEIYIKKSLMDKVIIEIEKLKPIVV